ncbi:MAG: hypothetical protein M1541_22200, partial [Acidobacteria bacterium]|nr:hypothetical protein [Acidobacteriota bacterium]
PWFIQTECLLEPGGAATLGLMVRFHQLQARVVEEAAGHAFRPVQQLDLEGAQFVTWEEGVERRVERAEIPLEELLSRGLEIELDVRRGREVELLRARDGDIRGSLMLERWAVSGSIRITAERVDRFVKLCVRIENLSPWPYDANRERSLALRHSLLGAHTLLCVGGGAFLSLQDPPREAAAAAQSCSNLHTWPVLAGAPGRRDIVLSSPIPLPDHPAAPGGAGGIADSGGMPAGKFDSPAPQKPGLDSVLNSQPEGRRGEA